MSAERLRFVVACAGLLVIVAGVPVRGRAGAAVRLAGALVILAAAAFP